MTRRLLRSRSLYSFLLVIGLAGALAFHLFTEHSQAQTTSRQKFVYKVLRIQKDEQDVQVIVDLFARDGWEVAALSDDFVIMKR